jgi:tetratricopeptide (TPR) repeat protein
MQEPMISLVRPDVPLDSLSNLKSTTLRCLAKELRVFSSLDGSTEFAKYNDITIADQVWIDALLSPPLTTTHVNLAIVKPATRELGGSYVDAILRRDSPKDVGIPTDFVSHAWRYSFASLVSALTTEAHERSKQSTSEEPRYYWNDIFVEDQNTTASRPEGYFFTAFRTAIESIGRTLLVLEPLSSPIPLTRAWCIWEIFCTVASSTATLEIAFPSTVQDEFEHVLLANFEDLVTYVSQVDSASSEAFDVSDQENIHRLIQDQLPGSFVRVDSAVCQGLRNYLEKCALSLLEKRGVLLKDLTEEGAVAFELCQDKETLDDATCDLLFQAGKYFREDGQLNKSEKLLERARVEILKRSSAAASKNNEKRLDIEIHLAKLYQLQDRGDESRVLLLHVLKDIEDNEDNGDSTRNGEYNKKKLQVHHRLAIVISEVLEKYSEADKHFETAMKGRMLCLGHSHCDTLQTCAAYAFSLFEREMYEESEEILRDVLKKMEIQMGKNHPSVNAIVFKLGRTLREQNKVKEAEVCYRRDLEQSLARLGDAHADTGTAHISLAELLSENKGDYVEAEEMYLKGLEIYGKALEPTHLWTLNTQSNFALMYCEMERFEDAVVWYRKCWTGCCESKTLGVDHEETAYAAYCVGKCLGKLPNRTKESDVEMEKMLRFGIVAYTKNKLSEDAKDCAKLLVSLFCNQGRNEDASELIEMHGIGLT